MPIIVQLKVGFYSEQWKKLSSAQPQSQSLKDWIASKLAEHSREKRDMASQGLAGSFPVPKALGQEFSDFQRRWEKEDKFKKAAQQTYFEVTQPEAAKLARQWAAEKPAVEESDLALMVEAIKAYAGNGGTASRETEELRNRKAREILATVFGMGNAPPVWPGETGADEEPVQAEEKKKD